MLPLHPRLHISALFPAKSSPKSLQFRPVLKVHHLQSITNTSFLPIHQPTTSFTGKSSINMHIYLNNIRLFLVYHAQNRNISIRFLHTAVFKNFPESPFFTRRLSRGNHEFSKIVALYRTDGRRESRISKNRRSLLHSRATHSQICFSITPPVHLEYNRAIRKIAELRVPESAKLWNFRLFSLSLLTVIAPNAMFILVNITQIMHN